jgi:putative aminopeptidase FrvX
VAKQYARMGATLASGRSLDDRAGCAAFLLAMQKLKTARLAHQVRFVFSVEEELGLLGADAAARAEAGAICFPVDTFVSSDAPMESRQIADAPLGQGCVVRAVDSSVIARRPLVARVLQVAREAHVPIQAGVTGGGNDGARYATEGAAVVPLAYPMRYSHSAAEVVDLRDVAALADLVAALARSF